MFSTIYHPLTLRVSMLSPDSDTASSWNISSRGFDVIQTCIHMLMIMINARSTIFILDNSLIPYVVYTRAIRSLTTRLPILLDPLIFLVVLAVTLYTHRRDCLMQSCLMSPVHWQLLSRRPSAGNGASPFPSIQVGCCLSASAVDPDWQR